MEPPVDSTAIAPRAQIEGVTRPIPEPEPVLGPPRSARIRPLALALGWLTLTPVIGRSAPGFDVLPAPAAGITFTNSVPSSRHLTNQIYLNGSGVALGDVDGDGRCDVLLGGMDGTTTLYRNRGDWRFEDVTASSGLDASGLDVSGVLLADLDGDGTPDLVWNTVGQGTRVWFGRNGRFEPGPLLNPGAGGMSLTAGDLDGDGDLDLYVANYRTRSVRDEPGARFGIQEENGRPRVVTYNGRSTNEPDLVGRFHVTPSGVKENGEPDVLYLNDGKGGFRPASWSDGTFVDEDGRPLTGPPYEWGLSAMIRDFTGDGLPDLYVCNDFESPDRFWINETPPGGRLRLRLVSTLALRNTSAFSMGVDAADIDRDGHVDFVVLDMLSRDHRLRQRQVSGLPPSFAVPGVLDDRPQFSQNTLFRGRGDGTFAEIGRLAGVAASEWSWTPVFLDVDLDGFEDLLISNGHEMDMMDVDIIERAEVLRQQRRMSPREQLELRRMFPRFNARNVAFRNRGDLTFEEVGAAWGFDVAEVALGMAAGDLDGDGDLDLVVNNLNAAPTLYRNRGSAPRLAVRLAGRAPNTAGIGARITVRGGPVVQTQEIVAGGRYLSGDEPVRTFAAGTSTHLMVEVTWRDGAVTVVSNVPPGRTLRVEQGTAGSASSTVATRPPADPWFEDVSDRIGHRHVENAFDDLARQPLLAGNLSMAGPGVTWVDLDGDGWEDLVVGAAQGGTPAAFRNDRQGGFVALTNAVLRRPLGRDATTIAPYGPVLLFGSSNYEDGLTNGGCLRLMDLARGTSGELVLGQPFSAGPVAVADVDADGVPEVFVGGRCLPGRHPAPAPSLLLKFGGGRFAVAHQWPEMGLVNGATFADLDDDGVPELVVAGTWAPIRVFGRGTDGWVERTADLGLDAFPGWWNSVVAVDVDADGRLDLVAGNWGRNHFWAGGPVHRALHAWYRPEGHPDGFAAIDGFTAPDGRILPIRRRASLAGAFPLMGDRFPDHTSYGEATLAELADPADEWRRLTATWMGSTVFLNRPGGFEARELPVEAQMSPVFGIGAADFDGDGHVDLFLGQNFFPVHPESARHDAGTGLLLAGDGRGGFRALSPAELGLVVAGEVRGVAVADFDHDGRPDLAVTQNGNATRLLRGRRGPPGLRLELQGRQPNPAGYGTRIRVPGRGATMVSGGGGYWSFDASTRVIRPWPATGGSIEVRSPSGVARTVAVPPGVTTFRVELP